MDKEEIEKLAAERGIPQDLLMLVHDRLDSDVKHASEKFLAQPIMAMAMVQLGHALPNAQMREMLNLVVQGALVHGFKEGGRSLKEMQDVMRPMVSDLVANALSPQTSTKEPS